MIALTGYSVFHYLLNRGLVKLTELFKGDLVIIDNPFPSARNANFIVRRLDGQNLFLKQPRSLNHLAERQKELLFYELVNESDLGLEAHCLKAVLPIDDRNQVLILNHSDRVISFETLLGRIPAPFRGSRLNEPTRQLGRLMANLREKLDLNRLRNRFSVHHFGTFTPWLLTLRESDIVQIETANNPYLAAFGRFVRQHKTALNERLADWQTSHLVNTDACWRNILAMADPLETTSRFVLIDWEFASAGDPLWELATLAAEYFLASVRTAVLATDVAISRDQYLELVPILLTASGYDVSSEPAACRKIHQLLGIILLQKYYRWAVEGTPDKLTDFPSVFLYAQRCLTQPERVISELKIGS
ncbi:phosphotransferase [Larkinella bovis]|uniref:Phosphotransferase n=1 Tax=Larkinella bovis TaxID=683041 RepID=A0ABW0I7K8_9BACT